MVKVFILGSAGTTGLRLHQRLAGRSDVELIEIEEVLRKDKSEILRLIGLSDFVFLCLPDDASREIVELSQGADAKIIDCSTAHRTDPRFTYGFPELSPKHRADIGTSRLLASPGCHASGFIALAYPLTAAGILNKSSALCCTSLTGYSGGGKSMIAEYEAKSRSALLDSPLEYALSQSHKHLPEIMKQCGLATAPAFMPIVGDFYSGMLVSLPLHASQLMRPTSLAEIRELFKKHYKGSSIISVSDETPSSLYASSLAGQDNMKIFVSGNDQRILLNAQFDNLGKGASGGAIQCFNLMCCLPEETSLKLS